MTRLDRLVLSEIFGPFIGSALLFSGLFFAGGDLLRFADYLQQGAGVWMVAEMILYRFPLIFSLTFPMAMLLSTLLAFGRLSGDSEIIAVVAAGISFERMVVPVAVFGLLVSIVGYWFNQTVVPMANSRGEALVRDFKRKGSTSVQSANPISIPLRDGDNMTLLHAEGGINVDPEAIASGSVELLNVSIEEWEHGTPVAFFRAQRADWVPGTKRWRLHHGQQAYLGANPEVSSFEDLATHEVTLDSPSDLSVLQLPVEQVPTSALRLRARVLRAGGNIGDARQAEVEIARRTELPFASLVFALIGAPLGVGSKRSGKGMGFGLSVLITFAYWMATQTLAIVAQGGLLPPALALAIPNVTCFAIALYLSSRVLRS